MESQDNPFLPPTNSEIPSQQRRQIQVNPLRSLENSLSGMATLVLSAAGLVGLLVLGFRAQSYFLPLYHLSLLTTIPLAWVVFMLPFYAWTCAKCCQSLPGRWAGRFSVLAIPLLIPVLQFLPSFRTDHLLMVLLPLVVGCFSVMLTDIADQLGSEGSKLAGGFSAVLCVLAAAFAAARPHFAPPESVLLLLTGIFVLANVVIIFRLRAYARRAHKAQISVPLAGNR
ncbi:MAG: hypothetical protein NXI04_17025 [Planctomycetaceae bacterium]|nr:hypothetical protein [Planctomycetaceae bacterium]